MSSFASVSEQAQSTGKQASKSLHPKCGNKLARISRERDLKIICKCGEPALITKRNGEEFEAVGIFDAPWLGSQLGTIQGEIQAPQFKCRTQDIEEVERGNEVFVADEHYKVVAVEPDGTGITILILRSVV